LALAQGENPTTAIQNISALSPEWVFLYQMTYRRASGNSPSNALLVAVTAIRANQASLASGFNPTDHQSLSNRSAANAHPATAVAVDTSSFGRLLTSSETDTQLALNKLNASAAPATVIEQFDSAGQTTFQLVTHIGTNDNIKVWIDGRLQREGAGNAWTRNTTLYQIITTETVPAGKWVYVEIIAG
jgi:hypothetical protein